MQHLYQRTDCKQRHWKENIFKNFVFLVISQVH